MGKLLFPDIHILKSEYACPCCGKLPPDIFNDIFYYQSFLIFEGIRDEWGRPIPISKGGGGWRCSHFQFQLIMAGKTEATLNPHSFWALDLDVDSKEDVLKLVHIIDHKYPELRKGYHKYLKQGKTFVHIDRMYEIKPQAQESWVKGYVW